MTNKVVAIQNAQDQSDKAIIANFNKVMEQYNYLDGIIFPNDKVLIKPNLVAPSEKATTDIILLKAMIQLVKMRKAIPIVAESSGFEFSTEATFKILGIDKLCRDAEAELINLDDQEYIEVDSGNPKVPVYLLPTIVTKVDRIIDMPCLKGHSLTKVTFAVKNLFGLLHRKTRREIHATDLDLGIAKLSKLIPVDFILVTGLWNLINAVYSDSFYQGIIIAGNNIYDTDKVCCQIFGINYKDIPHISLEADENNYNYDELTPITMHDNNLKEREAHFISQNRKYKLVYKVDRLFYALFKKSIIPYIHYYLGIRPVINTSLCTKCHKCEHVCPAGAISDGKIDAHKCMMVRCFKCHEACDQHAVEKKGFHK